MPTMMSSMLVLLAFTVIVAPAAAVYYPSVPCASIDRYQGNESPAGKKFTADKDLCAGAIRKVVSRTPIQNENIGECKPHTITYSGALSGFSGDVVNLVRCPAYPDAVWIKYDGVGYAIYYIPNRNDAGCSSGDAMVAGLGFAFGMQFDG